MALLVGDQPTEMQGVRMLWIGFQDPIVEASSLGQVTGLMTFDGIDQRGIRRFSRAATSLPWAPTRPQPGCAAWLSSG